MYMVCHKYLLKINVDWGYKLRWTEKKQCGKFKHSKSKVNWEAKNEQQKQKSVALSVWTIRVKCSSHTKPWLTKKTLINRWLDCARARNLSETWEINEICIWKIKTIVEAPCWTYVTLYISGWWCSMKNDFWPYTYGAHTICLLR